VVTLAVWLVLERLLPDVDSAVAWIKKCRKTTAPPQGRYLQWAREFAHKYHFEDERQPQPQPPPQAEGGVGGDARANTSP
jgi:hypothetical protein